jgi:hypothetical protein
MKLIKNTSILLFFVIGLVKVGYAQPNTIPNNFNVQVTSESGFLVVSVAYDGNIPLGTIGGLPSAGDYFVDFTVTLRWPNSAGVNLGTIVNTFSPGFEIKVGTELVNGSFEYQRFRANTLPIIPTNFIVGNYVEIFRIPYTATSPMPGDMAEIAPQGFINNAQPNISVDYQGIGDIIDFYPMDRFAFAPLPINIKNFSVSKLNERSAKLNWTTSLEINSDYFGIERSKDGDNWENIGKVAAAGNSDSELKYEYIDNKLPLIRSNEQVFYYRLRLTDLDGQFKYSDVRGINFGKSFAGLVTIYPNPTAERINVDISGMDLDAGKIDLSVFDMNGRRVIYKNIGGNGIELINVDSLPASTYNVMVKQGENVFQQRIIKID